MAAQRDSKGRFLKGNKISACNHVYAPRTTSGHFEDRVEELLSDIPISVVLERMNKLEDRDYTFSYLKFLELSHNRLTAKEKLALEYMKLEREKNPNKQLGETIEIGYKLPDEDE